ncbi:MAG: hypothetical protein ABSG42_06025 [Nitrospirota bacterium]
MNCPHLNEYETFICVSPDISIIPSKKHMEEYCTTSSHWACPLKKNFSQVVDAFSYSV